MSLSSREYVLKLLQVSAEALSVSYTKQTPTSLQNWVREESNGAFVANISFTEDRTPINLNSDYVNFNVGLFFVVSLDYDLTEEEKTKQENDANRLANRFLYLLKNNEDSVTVQNGNLETIFREGGYLGLGVAGVFTVSLADRDDYCDLFCNTSTKQIDKC
tara:strand:- start:3125 stop:3607 length:483 start_codon:yes stop_codon:yes gene_type:complete